MTLSNGNIFRVTGPPVTSGSPSQKPVTRSFDVFFDVRLDKRFNKQSSCLWFDIPRRSLWRQCNEDTVERQPFARIMKIIIHRTY